MSDPYSPPQPTDALCDLMDKMLVRLDRIEEAMKILLSQRTIKEWYSTDEVAEILGKAPFTVREWCRLSRVNAKKRETGRGNALEWVVSHDELERIRNHGLLPIPTFRHTPRSLPFLRGAEHDLNR